GRLAPERGVRERLERLVERADLVDDRREVLARVEAAVEGRDLRVQAIEPLEERVQLPIAELVLLHGANCRARAERSRTTRTSPPSRSLRRSRAFSPAASSSIRRAAPRWATAIRASGSGASVKTPSLWPAASSARMDELTSASGRR